MNRTWSWLIKVKNGTAPVLSIYFKLLLRRCRFSSWLSSDESSVKWSEHTWAALGRTGLFFKIGVFKNFAILTGKNLCKSLFLTKLPAWRSATFLKRRLHHICFLVNIAKFLNTTFCMEHLRWLLLKMIEEFLRNSNLTLRWSYMERFACYDLYDSYSV